MNVFRNAPKFFSAGVFSLATLLFSVTAAGADMARFKGELTMPKDAEIADGSTAKLMLVRVSGEYENPSPIATKDLDGISDRQVPYEIAVDRNKLEDDSQYALRAKVMNRDGEVTWTNGNIWPVEPMTNPVTSYLQLQPTEKSA